jgi:SAM-dependent methyltransferase
MTTSAWGGSAERYEKMYVDVAKELGIEELASPVVQFIEHERVLDLGCATGWQARLLVGRGCTVVGVEVDPAAAARATAWCERVIVCDLDFADLPTLLGVDRFDVIAAGDVLEHLRDPVRILRFLPHVLRPNGRVVASVPNISHGSVRLALLTGAFSYEEAGLLDRTHLRFFTLSTLQNMFESAGYVIDRLERVKVPIDKATPYDPALLPPGVEDAVAMMPEATTFQFLVVARPVEQIAHVAPMLGPSSDVDERHQLLKAQAGALRDRDETVLQLRRAISELEQRLQDRRISALRRLWRCGHNGFSRRIRALIRSSASTSRSSRHGPVDQ